MLKSAGVSPESTSARHLGSHSLLIPAERSPRGKAGRKRPTRWSLLFRPATRGPPPFPPPLRGLKKSPHPLIPADAGIQTLPKTPAIRWGKGWIPASAGTNVRFLHKLLRGRECEGAIALIHPPLDLLHCNTYMEVDDSWSAPLTRVRTMCNNQSFMGDFA